MREVAKPGETCEHTNAHWYEQAREPPQPCIACGDPLRVLIANCHELTYELNYIAEQLSDKTTREGDRHVVRLARLIREFELAMPAAT